MDGGRLAKRLVFIASNFVEDVLSKAEKIHRNYLLEQMIDPVVEAKRPRGFTEHHSGQDSWDDLGMRMKYCKPRIPGKSRMCMMDPLHVQLCLECIKPIRLADVSCWIYTCLFHKDEIEGMWRDVPLKYEKGSRDWNEYGITTYRFNTTLYPSECGEYRLTFFVKYMDNLIWANKFRMDHILTVFEAEEETMWTSEADHTQITKNIYIGNNKAISQAAALEVDHVVTLDKKMKPGSKTFVRHSVNNLDTNRVEYTNIPMHYGAGEHIPKAKLAKVVGKLFEWSKMDKKVLMVDTDGQGRVGSAMTAYVYANNPSLSFEEAYDYVKSRRMIYAHQGLKAALGEMYPRE